GGFRFAGMSHRGSLLCLPSGIYSWDAKVMADVTSDSLAQAMSEAPELNLLLLGTGTGQVFPSRELRSRLETAGIAREAVATGAAARTYNVLLAEGRRVGAALLAVE